MNKFYKLIFCVITLFLSTTKQIQSQVLIGDIAFTGYNSSPVPGSDDFTFVILKPGGLPASSVINFTDCGWGGNLAAACNSNNLFATNGSTETDITWTSPASILAYGTQVRIIGLTASAGTVTGLTLSLSGIGDQIFAFTGARTTPTFIAGIQMNIDASSNGNTWDNISAPSATSSNRPACLTDGTYSVWLGATETDNAAFRCASVPIPITQAAALAVINNAANWDKQDATPYIIPGACQTTPVKIISFQAQNNLTNISLKWLVSNQQNVSHYEIEYSIDARNFEKITNITAQISTGDIIYSYLDNNHLRINANIIYYRIKSVDVDGKFSYSNIISVRKSKNNEILVDNFTNPIQDNFSFNLTLKNASLVNVQVNNVNGKTLTHKTLNANAGRTTIILDEINVLAKGLYFLRVSTSLGNVVTKIVK